MKPRYKTADIHVLMLKYELIHKGSASAFCDKVSGILIFFFRIIRISVYFHSMEQKLNPDNFIPSAALFPDGFFMQKHVPVVMSKTHTHNHVEVMLPVRCAIHFATHAGQTVANDTEMCLLWGQLPHRVTAVEGDGFIYIANLSLQEILTLGFADDIVQSLLSGQLVTAKSQHMTDALKFEGWVHDYQSHHAVKMALAKTELHCRLRRQNLEGWHMMTGQGGAQAHHSLVASDKQMGRIQRMIRFMSEQYTQPITVSDIASAGGVSEGYAMGLFQKTIGTSLTAYLTKLRLYHAKSALIESSEKIVTVAMDSGFGSLSRFYEVFSQDTGQTPQSFRQSHKL